MKRILVATLLSLSFATSLIADSGRALAAGGGQTLTLIFGFAGSSGPASNPDPQGHIHLRNILFSWSIEARVVCVLPFTDPLTSAGAATLVGEVTRVSGNAPVAPAQTIRLAVLDLNPDALNVSFSAIPPGTPTPGQGICNSDLQDLEPVIHGNIIVHGYQ